MSIEATNIASPAGVENFASYKLSFPSPVAMAVGSMVDIGISTLPRRYGAQPVNPASPLRIRGCTCSSGCSNRLTRSIPRSGAAFCSHRIRAGDLSQFEDRLDDPC